MVRLFDAVVLAKKDRGEIIVSNATVFCFAEVCMMLCCRWLCFRGVRFSMRNVLNVVFCRLAS